MLKPDDEDEPLPAEVADALRGFDPDDPASHGKLCPTCHGETPNQTEIMDPEFFRRSASLSKTRAMTTPSGFPPRLTA